MIKHLRIDNRLIHGQVAVAWLRYINANAIIVCNDKVAADPIQKMALPLAAPGQKVLVQSISGLVEYEQAHPEESLFVIAKFPSDALEILDKIADVAAVNVGNAAPLPGTKFKMVTKSIAVTDSDAAVYRKVAEKIGGKLTTQMMPSNEPQDFLALLAKAKL